RGGASIIFAKPSPPAAGCTPTTNSAKKKKGARGHPHHARGFARWGARGGRRAAARVFARWRTSGRSAPRGLGCAETGRERVLLAHIRTAPGLAVTSAAAGGVDFGYGIDPHHGI